MISLLVIILCVHVLAHSIKLAQQRQQPQQAVIPTCPPHSWLWEKVYNEDGTIHHQHLVCIKCGPLHGVGSNE